MTIDELQQAFRTGGMAGLTQALSRLGGATAATAAAQTAFDRAVNSTVAIKNRLVEITRTQQLMVVQRQLLRDNVSNQARMRAVQSGDYARAQSAVRSVESEKARVKLYEDSIRLKQRMDAAESGAYADLAGEQKSLDRRGEMVALAERESMVRQGAYATDIKAQDEILRRRRQVEAMEKRAAYEARLGKRVGTLAYLADRAAGNPVVQAATGAAGMAGAGTTAMAMRGFSNTVEMNRLQLELQLVSRELAGAFLPAIQWTTRGLVGMRRWMESLTPQMQNVIMLAGLAGGAGVLFRMLGAGGLLGGAARMAGGGLGLGAIGAAGIGMATGNPYLAAGGGAYLGYGAGAALRGGVGGGRFLRMGRYGGAAGAAVGAAAGLALSADDVHRGENFDDYYARQRRAGYSAPGAWLRSMGAALGLVLGTTRIVDGERGTRGADPARRTVTPADAGFEEVGSGFDRITRSLGLVDAAGVEDTSTEGMLRDIRDFLRTTFGGTPAPRPEP